MAATLARRLGLVGSTAVGVASMVGAGLFVVFAPAVEAAGDGLVPALVAAAVVAACNAISSARLARVMPVAGGTYVYGRERLGPFWGHLAGWSFIAGKTASCAAMALAVGAYVWPSHDRLVAVAVVAVVTAVNLAGVQKSATASILVVVPVLAVVAVAVARMLAATPGPSTGAHPASATGVLQAAGLLFFAFAGYARLATLGEEVRDPARTIPRAIGIAFAVVLVAYAAAAVGLVHVLGVQALAESSRPFVDGVRAAGAPALAPWVTTAATVAAAGALLSLLLGVSRTTLAMARDGRLPRALDAVGSRHVPHRAEVAVALVVAALVLLGGLSASIAFSSFCVLVYYAVANASAWTLGSSAGRCVAATGLAGCVVLALSLPTRAVVVGATVSLAGAVAYAARRGVSDETRPDP